MQSTHLIFGLFQLGHAAYTSQLSQEIVSECDGMAEFRVWMDADGGNLNRYTWLILTDVHLDRDVYSENIPNVALPSKCWFTLNFEPDWDANDKYYLLTIRIDNQDIPGPRIAYSLRQEYPVGKLLENDQPINRGILFQTGCLAGFDNPH